MTEINEYEAVLKYRNGDLEAMSSVYSKYRSKLVYYAFRIVKNREIAEDVTQESFLRFLDYIKSGKYTETGRLVPFLFMTVRNTSINILRERAKKFDWLNKVQGEILIVANYNATEDMINVEEIMKIIFSLPDENKIPFTMMLEGYKYKEIAERLEIPLGTTKSRIFFARNILAKKIIKNDLL